MVDKKPQTTRLKQLRDELRQFLEVDENILWARIGSNVAKRRHQLGITQFQLASMLEYTRTSIANLEGGRQQMPLYKLVRVSKFLECGLDDLLEGAI